MNPLRWPREHQVVLVLGVMIGATLGVLLGYVFYALAYGPSPNSFGYWMQRPIHNSVPGWGLFGAVVGTASVYAIRMLRR